MTDASGLVERVVDSLARLTALGETITDEWTYVHDLETVWVARLRAVAVAVAPRLAESPLSPAALRELETAVDRLVAEADLVTDPHRAIDWLSALPQATLVVLGEAAW